MGINLGSTPIADIKLGETQVDKVYLGNELAWQNTPTPSTIRALKFECDSSQSLGISADYIGELTPNFEYSTDGTNWTEWDDLTMTFSEESIKPDYYKYDGTECIDWMEDQFGTEAVKGFCICNAFKYLWRCQEKHETPIEDIKKSVWYLNKFLELSKYD